jgi:tRNA threonylcarbamoyladenosine biosynthesis protein TsaE
MPQEITTHSAEETYQLGVSLGQKCPGPMILTLQGPLGAGKTQLIKGLLEGLGSSQQATSPTFALCHYYPGRVPLLHVDAYRLKHPSELPDLGLDEALEDGYAIALEWPDGLSKYLPPVDLEIRIEPVAGQPTVRAIEITGRSPLGEMVIQQQAG